jgi:hypothetical protein
MIFQVRQTRRDSYSFRDGFHSLSSNACANRGLEPRVVRDEEGMRKDHYLQERSKSTAGRGRPKRFPL